MAKYKVQLEDGRFVELETEDPALDGAQIRNSAPGFMPASSLPEEPGLSMPVPDYDPLEGPVKLEASERVQKALGAYRTLADVAMTYGTAMGGGGLLKAGATGALKRLIPEAAPSLLKKAAPYLGGLIGENAGATAGASAGSAVVGELNDPFYFDPAVPLENKVREAGKGASNFGAELYENTVPGADAVSTALNYAAPMLVDVPSQFARRVLDPVRNENKLIGSALWGGRNAESSLKTASNMSPEAAVSRVREQYPEAITVDALKAENPIRAIEDNLSTAMASKKEDFGMLDSTTVVPAAGNPEQLLAMRSTGERAAMLEEAKKTAQEVDDDLLKLALVKTEGAEVGADKFSTHLLARNALESNKARAVGSLPTGAELVASPEELAEMVTSGKRLSAVAAERDKVQYAMEQGFLSDTVTRGGKVAKNGIGTIYKTKMSPTEYLSALSDDAEQLTTQIEDLSQSLNGRLLDIVDGNRKLVTGGGFSPSELNSLKTRYADEAYRAKSMNQTDRQAMMEAAAAQKRAQLGQLAAEQGLGAEWEDLMDDYAAMTTLRDASKMTAGAVDARAMDAARSSLSVGARVTGSMTKPFVPFVRGAESYFQSGTDPVGALTYAFGQTPQQKIGRGIGNVGTGIRSLLIGGGQGFEQGTNPSRSMAPTSVPVMGRELDSIDPSVVEAVIGQYASPTVAGKWVLDWRRAWATGDKKKIGEYIGEVARLSPDLPISRGKVTGMPSEFDPGDGVSRLYSDVDKAEWEKTINASPLPSSEKALRVMALHRDGRVYPDTIQLNGLQKGMVPTDDPTATPGAMSLLKNYSFKPRVDQGGVSAKDFE